MRSTHGRMYFGSLERVRVFFEKGTQIIEKLHFSEIILVRKKVNIEKKVPA